MRMRASEPGTWSTTARRGARTVTSPWAGALRATVPRSRRPDWPSAVAARMRIRAARAARTMRGMGCPFGGGCVIRPESDCPEKHARGRNRPLRLRSYGRYTQIPRDPRGPTSRGGRVLALLGGSGYSRGERDDDPLPMERELHLFARFVDAPLHGRERDLERLRHLRVREPDDLAEEQCHLEIRVEGLHS